MGRPPLPKGAVKDVLLTIRMSPSERAEIDRAAKSNGKNASEWARGLLLDASRARTSDTDQGGATRQT